MVKGTSVVKKAVVPHGEHYYLAGASIVHRDSGDKFFVSVAKDGHTPLVSDEYETLEEMLTGFDRAVEQYRGIANQ